MTLLLFALAAGPAHATWTLTAVDPQTGQVGAAGATCGRWVWVAAGVVPDHGVVLAQGDSNLDARDEAMELLAEGQRPEDIVTAITRDDEDADARQYGVVSLDGPAAVFSGEALGDWYGSVASEHASVQGNLLAGEAVVEDAYAAYEDARQDGDDLALSLLEGLEAGAARGGDSRCDPEKGAKSAFLIVADATDAQGSPAVSLKVTQATGEGSPVEELRERWDAGERTARCSAAPARRAWAALALMLVLARSRRSVSAPGRGRR